MSFDAALRITEVLMACAFIHQSLEHLGVTRAPVFVLRILACVLLLTGLYAPAALITLCIISLILLARFGGPYNGGSDKMSLLILWCVTAAHILPTQTLRETALAYLAVQLTLSYFISGQIKIINPAWRSGQALRDVFAFSAYPVCEDMRALAGWPRRAWMLSWAVMVFEVLFPLSLLHPITLTAALCIGASFHLSNAIFFGLNRFFWIWLAAYPALIWFQARIF